MVKLKMREVNPPSGVNLLHVVKALIGYSLLFNYTIFL